MNKVLFICTGNYYRSRFAEAVFNYHAEKKRLNWCAFSRGLATWMVLPAHGPLAYEVRQHLQKRNIHESHTGISPAQLTQDDLAAAKKIIALKETEHRPMMLRQFPDWAAKIEYWTVHDIDVSHPDETLPEIEKQVLALLDFLVPKGSKRPKK